MLVCGLLLWDQTLNQSYRPTLQKKIDTHVYVKKVGFSPDQKNVAWIHRNKNELHVYNRLDLSHVSNLNTLELGVNDFDISNANVVAIGSILPEISVWEFQPKKKVALLRGHTASVNSVKFNSSGELLVSGADDGTIHIWDLAARKTLRTLEGHYAIVNAVELSHTGDSIISIGYDGNVILWETETGELLNKFPLPGIPLTLRRIKDSLVITNEQGYVFFLDLKTGSLQKIKAHHGPIQAIALSPGGKTLFTGGWDGRLKARSTTAPGKEQWSIQAHDDYIFSIAISSDSSQIITAGRDNSVKLWSWDNSNKKHFVD